MSNAAAFQEIHRRAERVLAAIDESTAARSVAELVRFRTVNPPGDEGALAAHLAARLEKFGFSVVVDEVLPGRPNVVARLTGRVDGPVVLFNTHMDVVPPGPGWRRDPFAGEVAEGRVYGRGAADAKGSLAAFLLAGEALATNGLVSEGELVVTAVVDEEGASEGARRLAPAIAADHAIVGEPTGLDVVIAHRGSVRPVITVDGRAGHSSRPESGLNAVYKAARAITALEAYAGSLGGRIHPLVGSPTLAVTLVQGGHKENMIPDRCEVVIDRRLIPGEAKAQALADIEDVLAGLHAADPEFRAAISRLIPIPRSPAETPVDAPVVSALVHAGRAVLGRTPSACGFPAGCDMEYFRAAGIPTAVFGPGHLACAHAPDEWVATRDVADAARIYALAALHLLAAPTKI